MPHRTPPSEETTGGQPQRGGNTMPPKGQLPEAGRRPRSDAQGIPSEIRERGGGPAPGAMARLSRPRCLLRRSTAGRCPQQSAGDTPAYRRLQRDIVPEVRRARRVPERSWRPRKVGATATQMRWEGTVVPPPGVVPPTGVVPWRRRLPGGPLPGGARRRGARGTPIQGPEERGTGPGQGGRATAQSRAT